MRGTPILACLLLFSLSPAEDAAASRFGKATLLRQALPGRDAQW
jgi:hypothetical protein